MGDNISDEKFEVILLQGFVDDDQFAKMTSVHSPNFIVDEVQTRMINCTLTDSCDQAILTQWLAGEQQ